MSRGLINFVALLFGVSRQLTFAAGALELLPIGYYLDNPSLLLMPALRMLVLDIMQSAYKSLPLLLQVGIGEAH